MTPRLAAENSRLRARVSELEALVLRLSEENDKLVAARAEELLVETVDGPRRMAEILPYAFGPDDLTRMG